VTTVLLVRHGLTATTGHVLTGWTPGIPLDDRGQAQAAALAARLGGITAPTLVIWGEADRIVTPGYGKEYAAAIPGAVFRMVPAAGHLPQLETPDAVLELFAD